MTSSELHQFASMWCVQSYDAQEGEPEIFEFTLQGLFNFLQECNALARREREGEA